MFGPKARSTHMDNLEREIRDALAKEITKEGIDINRKVVRRSIPRPPSATKPRIIRSFNSDSLRCADSKQLCTTR
jgi:hypothetical protein